MTQWVKKVTSKLDPIKGESLAHWYMAINSEDGKSYPRPQTYLH